VVLPQTIKLINAPGVRMPVVALGTGGYSNATAQAAVLLGLHNNVTHIHSAADYSNVQGVGKGLAAAKAAGIVSPFVTAMTSPCIHTAGSSFIRNISDPLACEALTTKELHANLALLGLKKVDLMLLHGPSESFGYEGACGPKICTLNQAQWRAYQTFLKAGLTRAIGVSNYCQSCIDCLLADKTTTVKPAVNQIQFHIGQGSNDPEGLMSYNARHGIIVQAYSPLASGGVFTDPLTVKIAKNYAGKSSAQIGLRYVLQAPVAMPAMVVKADKV